MVIDNFIYTFTENCTYMKSFFSGILGGFIIISIFIVAIFSLDLFNYQVEIINPKTAIQSDYPSEKIKLLNEMEKKGILLTPQEYTSNVVSYYNTALLILSAMLVLFSAVSYFHLKFLSEEQLRNKLRSKEFETIMLNAILGKVEERFAKLEEFDKLDEKLLLLESKLAEYDDSKHSDEQIIED